MAARLVDEKEISEFLSKHSEWSYSDHKLHKTFRFKNFVEAFAFMTQVALHAEKKDHHPEWSNVYNIVKISLRTHDVGNKVSHKDLELAHLIDSL